MLNQTQKPKREISKIDGKPIVKVNAANLYHTKRFTKYINKLAAKDGPAIVLALREEASSLKKHQSASVAIKDLKNYTGQTLKSQKNGSATSSNMAKLANVGSELHVKDSDGEVEKFVMTLHPWVPNPARESSKQVVQRMVGSANNNAGNSAGGDTYLALDPDFFYVHDNSSGEENYPITFPAMSLTDNTQKMMVTATRKANGKVAFHFNQSGSAAKNAHSTSNTSVANQPNLVFAEPTPMLEPNTLDPGPGDGGGVGPGPSGPHTCQEVDNRGGDTGGTTTGTAYFYIDRVHLWATGDGDGAAELQMFVKNDDNYEDNCFPGEYKYRFDNVRNWTGAIDHTIQGADGQTYYINDVNNDGITYDVALDNGNYSNPISFPLFDLTNHPGPWRLVLVDDDKDYKDFATNHVHEEPYYKEVQTFDMSTGQWSEVHTGFTTTEKTNGNSDDPIQESGVRKITKANASNRKDTYGRITATKTYPGGRFSYEFTAVGVFQF